LAVCFERFNLARDRKTEGKTASENGSAPSQSRVVTKVMRDAAKALYIFGHFSELRIAERKLRAVGVSLMFLGSAERAELFIISKLLHGFFGN